MQRLGRHRVTGEWAALWVPLTFWGLKMILYFLLLPDILSALTIFVDTPHRPCTAAHPARHSSPRPVVPRLTEPDHPRRK